MATEDERTIRKDTGIPPGAKALMVLVAVVTLLAVWLVPSDKKEVPPALPEMVTPPQAEQAIALPPPPTEEGEDTAIVRGGDRARAIIARLRAENTEPDADEVFAHAEQLQSESQLDDAYLLYRFAARQGHTQAALVVGSQADPAFHTSETSILPKPDLEQAYKWYRVAAAAGNEEAVTRLQRLRERVEQSAADGNAPARRLMLQWQ
jgi:TPR repeat protein